MRPPRSAKSVVGPGRTRTAALVHRNSFAPRRADVRLEVLPVLERVVRSYTTPVRARGVAAATVLGARARVALMMHVVLEVLEPVERARRFAAPAPRAVLSAAAPVVRAEAKVVALLGAAVPAVDGRRSRRIRRRGDHRVSRPAAYGSCSLHAPYLISECLRARGRARKQTPKKERQESSGSSVVGRSARRQRPFGLGRLFLSFF